MVDLRGWSENIFNHITVINLFFHKLKHFHSKFYKSKF
jgi:hypothetical protein